MPKRISDTLLRERTTNPEAKLQENIMEVFTEHSVTIVKAVFGNLEKLPVVSVVG